MTARLAVRRLAYADLPQVVSIERRSFPAPWSLAMFVLELSKPGSVCLAAVAPREPGASGPEPLRGYCVTVRHADVWHLMDLAVDPDHRREGVGSTLLEAVLERLPAGAKITLEVRRSNEAAVSLYLRFGFLVAGERRGYYADNGEDAVIMWRTPATLTGRLADVPNPSPVPT